MTPEHRDLIVTWPKTRPLGSYLMELRRAHERGLQINYRVARCPDIPAYWDKRSPRCYMVYDGVVRGYNDILGVEFRGPRDVARVESDAWAGYWPQGWYIVRNPLFHPVSPVAMRGFRGYRYWPADVPLPEERAAANG